MTTTSSSSKTTSIPITVTPSSTGTIDVALITATSGPSTTATPQATSETIPPAETTAATGPGPALNSEWVAGPVVGSVLGMATVFLVIYCTRRKQKKEEWELGPVAPKDFREDDESPTNEHAGKAQLHGECIVPQEVDNTEIIPPVELPALEPVGMELLTPRDEAPEKEWPIPISPLPRLFAEAELRDQRMGADSPKHNTFYNP
ncbi:hypothetical protein B0J14DRAFT_101000 [Halenospora varia]|nr:hypothetical protein B0J14DRAFT_101000 [Halenospora varia]